MQLVSLQGNVYVANRLAGGVPGAFRHLGNVPSVEIQLTSNTVEHFESQSGQRLQDGILDTGKTAALTITLDEWSPKNLALALYGSSATLAGGPVVDEPLPDNLAVEDYVRLAGMDISSLVVEDSAGTPAELTLDTHYRIASAKHGTLQILDLGAFTQPFVASYTDGGGTNIALFDTAPAELWLMVDGVNTAEANKPVKGELYRVRFNPVSSLQLIHNDGYGPMELTGAALYDSTKVADTVLGQFGRMAEPTVA